MRPPPSLQASNSAGDRCICPANSGLFEFVLVSTPVSADEEDGSRPSVSARRNSVPDSDFRDWFDDWVVGHQFEPNYLHHPVIDIELRPVSSHEPRHNGGISNLCESLDRSPAAGMAASALPSLHRKFPFPAPSQRRVRHECEENGPRSSNPPGAWGGGKPDERCCLE